MAQYYFQLLILGLATTTSLWLKTVNSIHHSPLNMESMSFLRIPFGIHVAPSYFALMINETLKGIDFCFAYLTDIIIYSETEQQHIDHIGQVFN